MRAGMRLVESARGNVIYNLMALFDEAKNLRQLGYFGPYLSTPLYWEL